MLYTILSTRPVASEKEKFLNKIENPSTKKAISLKLEISLGTTSEIIINDMTYKRAFSSKVDMLLPKHTDEIKIYYIKL